MYCVQTVRSVVPRGSKTAKRSVYEEHTKAVNRLQAPLSQCGSRGSSVAAEHSARLAENARIYVSPSLQRTPRLDSPPQVTGDVARTRSKRHRDTQSSGSATELGKADPSAKHPHLTTTLKNRASIDSVSVQNSERRCCELIVKSARQHQTPDIDNKQPVTRVKLKNNKKKATKPDGMTID